MSGEAVIAAGLALLVLCLAGLLFAGGGERGELDRRAQRLAAGIAGGRRRAALSGPKGLMRTEADDGRSVRALERAVLRYLPRSDVLETRLARTGREISIGRYTALCVMVAALVFAIGIALGLSIIPAFGFGVATGALFPHFIIGRMAQKRLARFAALFPEAIDLMVRGLRSGLPIGETIASAGREVAAPVGPEFRAVTDRVKLGHPLEEALWDCAGRLNSPDFRFFVISLSVQRETGGNLAETLANLADLLRRRRQMKLKIRAMSSEARASAMILGSLPFIMLGILFLLNHDYIMQLFTDPRGLMMVAVGIASLLAGIAVMARLVRFDF